MGKKKDVDAILNKGISLERQNINEYAFSKENVLKIIRQLEQINIGIAGGDVYKRKKKFFIPTYDNWQCDIQAGETENEYVQRSCDVALKYIANYHTDLNIFFVIVPLTDFILARYK